VIPAPGAAATLQMSALVPASPWRSTGGGTLGRAPDPCELDPLLNAACAAGKAIDVTVGDLPTRTVDATVIIPLSKLAMAAVQTLLKLFLQIWLDFSSFDIHRQGALKLYGLTLSVGWLIAVMLLIWQSIRTMITGKPTPILEAMRGLFIMSLTCMLGLTLVGVLLQGSDALSRWIMGDLATGGVLNEQILKMMDPTGTVGSYLSLMISFLLVVVLLIQLLVLFLRNATLPILAILLPVAAAGQIGGGATRQWLPKTITAVIAVICYKPMVSLIIVAAIAQLRDSTAAAGAVFGLLLFLLSVIAMPALMKVFAPLGTAAAGGAGGGAAYLATAAMHLAGRFGGSPGQGGAAVTPTPVAEHARRMEQLAATGAPGAPAGSPAPSGAGPSLASATGVNLSSGSPGSLPATAAGGEPGAAAPAAGAASATPAAPVPSTAASSAPAAGGAGTVAAGVATGGAALGVAAVTSAASTTAAAGGAQTPPATTSPPADPGKPMERGPGGLSVYDRN
jgi:type IV secretion system protein TrbL